MQPTVSRLVPWGTAGYMYIPEQLRQAWGAPKYQRSEPVLMLGNQNLYTNVYKCLMQHNTIINTEQVLWDVDAPKGEYFAKRKSKSRQLCIKDITPGLITQDDDVPHVLETSGAVAPVSMQLKAKAACSSSNAAAGTGGGRSPEVVCHLTTPTTPSVTGISKCTAVSLEAGGI